MKTSWMIGLVTLYVVLSIIAGIMEMSYLGAGEVSRLQLLMQLDVPESTVPIIGTAFAYLTAGFNWIRNLWGVFWFDYPFFQGRWLIVRYALFMPVSIGVIVTIMLGIIARITGR